MRCHCIDAGPSHVSAMRAISMNTCAWPSSSRSQNASATCALPRRWARVDIGPHGGREERDPVGVVVSAALTSPDLGADLLEMLLVLVTPAVLRRVVHVALDCRQVPVQILDVSERATAIAAEADDGSGRGGGA
jgi:hypothetical protein